MAASIGAIDHPTIYNLTVNGEQFRVGADGVQTLRCKVADWLTRRSTDGEPVPPCLVKFFHDEEGLVAEGDDELPGGLVDLVAVQEGSGNYRKITGPDRSEMDFDFMLPGWASGAGLRGPPPDVARLPTKLHPGWYYYNPASEIDGAAFIEWCEKRELGLLNMEHYLFRPAPKHWRSAFLRKVIAFPTDPSTSSPFDRLRFVLHDKQIIEDLTQFDIKQILAWGVDSQDWGKADEYTHIRWAKMLASMFVHVDVEDAEAWKQTDLKILKRLRSQLRDVDVRADRDWKDKTLLALQDVIINLQSRFLSSTDESGPASTVPKSCSCPGRA